MSRLNLKNIDEVLDFMEAEMSFESLHARREWEILMDDHFDKYIDVHVWDVDGRVYDGEYDDYKFFSDYIEAVCKSIMDECRRTDDDGNIYYTYNDQGLCVFPSGYEKCPRCEDYTNPSNFDGTLQEGEKICKCCTAEFE